MGKYFSGVKEEITIEDGRALWLEFERESSTFRMLCASAGVGQHAQRTSEGWNKISSILKEWAQAMLPDKSSEQLIASIRSGALSEENLPQMDRRLLVNYVDKRSTSTLMFTMTFAEVKCLGPSWALDPSALGRYLCSKGVPHALRSRIPPDEDASQHEVDKYKVLIGGDKVENFVKFLGGPAVYDERSVARAAEFLTVWATAVRREGTDE